MIGFFLSAIFLIICFVLIIRSFFNAKIKPPSDTDTTYAKTRSFMDFNPGEDLDKIGDCHYPTAGIDSVMKNEVLENMLDEENQLSQK